MTVTGTAASIRGFFGRAGTPAADSEPRPMWQAALVVAAIAVVLGGPLVIAALVGDQLRYPGTAAALRACWIGLYAGVGLYFARTRPEWRLGLLMTTVGAVSAVASVDALSGSGPYTLSRIAMLALVPLCALMLVAFAPGSSDRGIESALLVASLPVLLAIGTAYLMVSPSAPWSQAVSQCRGTCADSAIQVADAPGVARGLLVALAVAGCGVLAAALTLLVRRIRTSTAVARRTLTPVAWLTLVWGVSLCAGLIAVAVDPSRDQMAPYLAATGAIRALLPLGLLGALTWYAARTRAIQVDLMPRLAGARDPAQVQRLISEALRDPSLRLAFRGDSGWVDVDGRPLAEEDVHGDGRAWVDMTMSGAAAGTVTFDPALRTLGERVQAIAALGAVALERARADEERRALQRRLVAVAEGERRRIERTLHDGAQQHLVGMMVRMAVAREVLAAQPEMAQDIMSELGLEVQHALEELRELAHGLYPPVLVDHGLAEALGSAARHCPLPVETDIEGVGRFDPVREAAVYFCCAEALQNAVKHGGPDPRISVALLAEANGDVVFEVADGGAGFIVAPPRTGSGLMGMHDRIEGVGGTLTIRSAPGRGTVVRGRVPTGGAAFDTAPGGPPP
jgi:signal transduction histidine kinase